MQPGTILEYVDGTAYIIRQGGPSLQKSAPRLSEEHLGLPDAVIDIWKTGVEFWGYTYSSTFSMPEDVSYYHG